MITCRRSIVVNRIDCPDVDLPGLDGVRGVAIGTALLVGGHVLLGRDGLALGVGMLVDDAIIDTENGLPVGWLDYDPY